MEHEPREIDTEVHYRIGSLEKLLNLSDDFKNL